MPGMYDPRPSTGQVALRCGRTRESFEHCVVRSDSRATSAEIIAMRCGMGAKPRGKVLNDMRSTLGWLPQLRGGLPLSGAHR
jgi:hypothetical protein